MPRLETDRDRTAEEITISRLLRLFPATASQITAPDLAVVDRFIIVEGRLHTAVEIKTRKQTAGEVQTYGGLILKHRKLTELRNLANLLQIRTRIVFAFESGLGDLYSLDPTLIADVIPTTPPRRRNFRNLATDDELVVLLDWHRHLRPIRTDTHD